MAYIIGKLKGLKKRVLTSATTLKEIPGFVGIRQAEVLDFSTHDEELKINFKVKNSSSSR
jgi:hypothetical protein